MPSPTHVVRMRTIWGHHFFRSSDMHTVRVLLRLAVTVVTTHLDTFGSSGKQTLCEHLPNGITCSIYAPRRQNVPIIAARGVAPPPLLSFPLRPGYRHQMSRRLPVFMPPPPTEKILKITNRPCPLLLGIVRYQ